MNPLVSVICLCYNHERFVARAMQSVLEQQYPEVELLVVDDSSLDHSVAIIKKFISTHPQIQFIQMPSNQGNCKAFNLAFREAKGDYIIDLAADDILMPERITEGIRVFDLKGKDMGVHFSDAEIIDAEGNILGHHSDRFPSSEVPQGNVYTQILQRYFINSPTMMMRREVLERMGGYDESLSYEDFDFWVRSSRDFLYFYSALPLVKRRVLINSMGRRQYKPGTSQMDSTFKVCEKALQLNRTSGEHAALRKRIHYESLQALKLLKLNLVGKYFGLLQRIP